MLNFLNPEYLLCKTLPHTYKHLAKQLEEAWRQMSNSIWLVHRPFVEFAVSFVRRG